MWKKVKKDKYRSGIEQWWHMKQCGSIKIVMHVGWKIAPCPVVLSWRQNAANHPRTRDKSRIRELYKRALLQEWWSGLWMGLCEQLSCRPSRLEKIKEEGALLSLHRPCPDKETVSLSTVVSLHHSVARLPMLALTVYRNRNNQENRTKYLVLQNSDDKRWKTATGNTWCKLQGKEPFATPICLRIKSSTPWVTETWKDSRVVD